MEHSSNSIINRACRALAVVTALLLVLLAAGLTGCTSEFAGAEKQTASDLESMRYVELDPRTDAELQAELSDAGREYLEMFLGKAGEFDFEITGVDSTDERTIVHVRITTYDFASEYLKSWSEFLEQESAVGKAGAEKAGDNKAGSEGDKTPDTEPYNTAELYEKIFYNLSNAQSKDYTADVDVTCIQLDDGSWVTDAMSNSALRKAIFGGMIDEIGSLAGLEAAD